MNPSRTLGVVIALLLTVGACGSGDDSKPGAPGVYSDIAAEQDCAVLQAGFDRNMDDAERRDPGTRLRDVVLSYADAYDAQMKAAGCY